MSAVQPPARGRRLVLALAAASALGLVTAGCGLTGPSEPLDRERERLNQARAQWRSQGILDYRYTFHRVCFCAPASLEPVVVTVGGGAVVEVDRVTDGAQLDPSFYYTVEGLFGLLEEAIDGDAAELRVEYDAALGYPRSAFIDRSAMIADEELGFEASNLQRLR
jgi:Family of unknown function (DUF6174)